MSNENKKIKLEDLGYSEFFESGRKTLGLTGYSIARVIAEYKEAYRVKGINGEYSAKVTGKQIFNATKRDDYPAVGDWVVVTEPDKERAVIHDTLPRKTILKKKYNKIEFISAGSSLKFCLIAEGLADIYPRFGPTMEWDTAAGQIIVEQANGKVLNRETKKPLTYNKENLLNPWFIVGKEELLNVISYVA